MPIFPVRRLGDLGILTDPNPYDLPPHALSNGNNVRFENGKITRSPGFKSIYESTIVTTPVFSFTHRTTGTSDKIGLADITGTSSLFVSGSEINTTPTVFTPVSSTAPFSYSYLAGVSYLNRSSDVPQYYNPGTGKFIKLTNWPATYKAGVLRAYRSFLVALNITKGANNYDTLVKWSDITLANSIPASWDETDPTKSAGENPLIEMTSPILDGLSLRDAFIIYSKNQVQLMEYTADQQVFRFRKLFDDIGIMGTNCVCEREGKHYVFGQNDIYVHDGISWSSIIKGKNHSYVFNNLIGSEAHKFSVVLNESLSEIMFNYVSGDSEAGFLGSTYCNRSAVFNYVNNTWAFRDLPNTGTPTLAALTNGSTWASISGTTWDIAGGTWQSLSDTAKGNIMFPSITESSLGISSPTMTAYDTYRGGTVNLSFTSTLNKSAWVERIGIDLDETGSQIRSYNVLKSIYPQGNAVNGTGNFSFYFAATNFDDLQPSYGSPVTYAPPSQHKLDTRVAGRYLAWKLMNSSSYDFELSGFDADITKTGSR